MKLINEEKPSEKAIEKYLEKLHLFLSHLNLKISIILYESPMSWGWSTNGVFEAMTNDWIKYLIVNGEGIENLNVVFQRDTISDNELDRSIWDDAYTIQNSVFSYLKKDLTIPANKEEYLKLWDHLKSFS